jgi:hypothetical protein
MAQDWHQLVGRYVITSIIFTAAASIDYLAEFLCLVGVAFMHLLEADFEVVYRH